MTSARNQLTQVGLSSPTVQARRAESPTYVLAGVLSIRGMARRLYLGAKTSAGKSGAGRVTWDSASRSKSSSSSLVCQGNGDQR